MHAMSASDFYDHAVLLLYRVGAYVALNLGEDAALLALVFC